MYAKWIKLFLRLALASAFLSAVADRFGLWPQEMTVWGNWSSFLKYTQTINPWASESLIPFLGWIATVAETIFALSLLVGFKTESVAKWSGILLLIFAFSMTFSRGIKSAFDASVFTASAGAFALSLIKEKFLEIDCLIKHKNRPLYNSNKKG